MPPMRDELRATLGVVLWSDLQAHVKRDGVIVVGAALDLVDAGAALAENDSARVEQWIGSGLLSKPTLADLERWSIDRAARFDALIVAPFVLIRPHERPASESN